MADYNLRGLNPRDFQHLVQAIARKVISPGVTAYGDGKDGARDLAYSGSMNYPAKGKPWNGYLVMGCKFQQKASASVKEAAWAHKQLDQDLQKFTNARRTLKKPEYFIFVTNVSLSAVADVGGRDSITRLMASYKKAIGLKGVSVWDYNDLRGFIDGDASIRSAFGHLITVGDVLTTVVKTLTMRRPDFLVAMNSFMQKELIADMSAKLQSAGDDPEIQIPLANVFVDLPIALTPEAAMSNANDGSASYTAVKQLLLSGSHILRRIELGEMNISGNQAPPSRYVIVGGPGQGKSTLGQYVCQIYRAAFLQDRPRQTLDSRIEGIIKQLSFQVKALGGATL